MFKLFVLATVVLYCNGCFSPNLDLTDDGCIDMDGTFHEYNSIWEDGTYTCVCIQPEPKCCPSDEVNAGKEDESFDDSDLVDEDGDDNSNEDVENSDEYLDAVQNAIAALRDGAGEK